MKIRLRPLFYHSPSKVLINLFVLSLFAYCLPQYRLVGSLSVETFGLGLAIILLACFGVYKAGKMNRGILMFGFFLCLVNVFSQFVSPFSPTPQFFKIFFLGICFVFITNYFVEINPIIKSTFLAHVALVSVLVVYGTYIYITGDMEGTQTTTNNWKSIGRYWGFRYTVSTRNDDIFYIIPSCFILFNYALYPRSRAWKIASYFGFFSFFVVVFLSFSRGHILAAVITAMAVVFLKMQHDDKFDRLGLSRKYSSTRVLTKFLSRMIGAVIAIIFGLYIIGLLIPDFKLLLNLGYKVLSIVDDSAQLEALNMRSSNSARMNILLITWDLITKYPLGVGAENFQYASMAEGHGRYWGENTYLEYLVGFGIIGGIGIVILLLYPVVKLFLMYRVNGRSLDLLYLSLSLYISVAAQFNVLVGNLYFYLLLAMIYSYIIHDKYLKKRSDL
jgi:hypothetical protein